MPSDCFILEPASVSVFFEPCLDFNADVSLMYSADRSVRFRDSFLITFDFLAVHFVSY